MKILGNRVFGGGEQEEDRRGGPVLSDDNDVIIMYVGNYQNIFLTNTFPLLTVVEVVVRKHTIHK